MCSKILNLHKTLLKTRDPLKSSSVMCLRKMDCVGQMFLHMEQTMFQLTMTETIQFFSQENKNVIAAHCNDHILHNCAKMARWQPLRTYFLAVGSDCPMAIWEVLAVQENEMASDE